MKAAGACIVPINLLGGQELDGKMLKHICGSGPVYLRALSEIRIDKTEVQYYIHRVCSGSKNAKFCKNVLVFHNNTLYNVSTLF